MKVRNRPSCDDCYSRGIRWLPSPEVCRVLKSCDENTTWWRSTFWANYRGEWEWSVMQDSEFTIHRSDGRVRVYRRRNKSFADCCILGRDHFGDGESPFIWAGIAHMTFAPISSLSKRIWMPNATEMKFLRGTLSNCFKIMVLSLF